MLNKYLRKKSVKTIYIYILEQENNICMYVSRISASGLSDNLCPSLQSWLSQVCQVCLRFCLRSLSSLSFSILLFDTDGSLSYSRDLKYFVLFYWVVEIKVIFVLSCMMDCWKLVFWLRQKPEMSYSVSCSAHVCQKHWIFIFLFQVSLKYLYFTLYFTS